MSSYQRHYAAHAAARLLTANLFHELPEWEQSEPAVLLLESYLAGSDNYRITHRLTGYNLLAYIRKRAAEYYEDHYQLPHHDPYTALAIKSAIEMALIKATGDDMSLILLTGFWHGARLSGTMYATHNRN